MPHHIAPTWTPYQQRPLWEIIAHRDNIRRLRSPRMRERYAASEAKLSAEIAEREKISGESSLT